MIGHAIVILNTCVFQELGLQKFIAARQCCFWRDVIIRVEGKVEGNVGDL